MSDNREEAPDPLEVLAFVHGYSTLPPDRWKARFPEWHPRVPVAIARFRLETDDGRLGWAKSDVTVNCQTDAIHRWAFLPLFCAALDGARRP